ncbi:MAG: DMT family transporter [Bacteroidales bacterium]|nr:DMT family transporter [Bacteroidales bacterium]
MNSLKTAMHNAGGLVMAHLGAMIAVVFWGLSFVSTSYIMDNGGLTPTEAYVYRFIIAYALVVCISHKRLMCNNWQDEGLMLLCGMSAGSIYFIAENTALKMTLTTNVSLLSSTSPLVTVLLVGLIYKSERPGRGIIIGSIVAFAGVVFVIFNSFLGSAMSLKISPLGDLLALSTSVCWALYSLILKRLNVVYDAMFITRKTFFYGIITALPFLALEPSLESPIEVLSNRWVLGNLVFLALGASIISFFLWARTIDKVGAVKANNYMYLQPVVTLVASAIIFHDPITVLGITGFVLILFGLWLGDYLQARIAAKRAMAPPAPNPAPDRKEAIDRKDIREPKEIIETKPIIEPQEGIDITSALERKTRREPQRQKEL